jgi:hypothetical protein
MAIPPLPPPHTHTHTHTGYQSDSDDNISDIAEEIVMQVMEGDRGAMMRESAEQVTHPKEKAKNASPGWTGVGKSAIHRAWQSDRIQQVAGDSTGGKKKTKSVRFTVSPPPPTPVFASAPSISTSPPDNVGTGASEKHTKLQWKQVVPSSSKV